MTAFIPVPNCPGWTYRIQEFMPGGYQLDAVHADGRSLAFTGIDPGAMLKQCIADIATRFDE